MKIRIKFKKTGSMKFIGHLDMMRYFQRAINRADLDIAYTEGYSPHPIMSFALPLGVGTESEGEYFDIQVHSSQTSAASIQLLNEQMADGMEVLSYKKLADDAKKSMALVEAADYRLSYRPSKAPMGDWKQALETFYAQPQILITKQTKKAERELDLKKLIFDLSVNEDNSIFMRVKAGSVNNIKPQLVMDAFHAYLGQTLDSFALEICRLDLLMLSEDNITKAGQTDSGEPVFVSLDLDGDDLHE